MKFIIINWFVYDCFLAEFFEFTILTFEKDLIIGAFYWTQSFHKISIVIRRMKLNEFYFCIHSFCYFFSEIRLASTWSTGKNKVFIRLKKIYV